MARYDFRSPRLFVAQPLAADGAVPLDAPGTLLTPRVNQLDLSFSKRITVRGIKFDPKEVTEDSLKTYISSMGFKAAEEPKV